MPGFQSREELYDVLDKTTAELQANEAFKERIARADVSVAFVVPELEAEYSLYFVKGEIRGSAGGASDTSISVILSSETLDGLLSGEVDGETAYMTGAISLRGDEWTAQTVAGYMGSICAAYNAVTR